MSKTINITTLPGYTNLPAGNYNVDVVANKEGYAPSAPSQSVSYTRVPSVIPFLFEGNKLTKYTGNATEVTIPSSYSLGNIVPQRKTWTGEDWYIAYNLMNLDLGDEFFEDESNYPLTIIADGTTYTANTPQDFYNLWEPLNYAFTIEMDVPVQQYIEGNDYSVTTIGNSAFNSCRSLTSIEIPNSITSINDYAFMNCSGLTSITIPDSVTSIGIQVLQSCTNLIGVTIGGGLTSIAGSLFAGCTKLTSIEIPSNITAIGNSAFSGCILLASINIPDSVTSIGTSAFYSCRSLTSITIPNGITSIGNNTFNGCSNLTTINIPDSVTSIGSNVFDGCSGLQNTDGDLIYIKNTHGAINNYWCLYDTTNTTLTSATINNSCKIIAGSVFYNCNSLASVTIPSSVINIGSAAFYNCRSLTSITIPNSITSIGETVFSGCSMLTSITIPDSVTSIGARAFESCTSLTTLIVNANYNNTANSNTLTSGQNYGSGKNPNIINAFGFYTVTWNKVT